MAKKKRKKSKKSSLEGRPKWFSNTRLHFWGLFLLGILLYANTLSHDYTQDDAIVIYDNEFTQQGIAGIPDILSYDTFRGFFKEAGKDKLVAGGRYRPFTLLMFALEWELFGRSPWIGHLINALLYGLTGAMIYLLLFNLLSSDPRPGYGRFVALVAALVFITHPIHTEAIANIKGRDEIVALLGSLAALYFSLKAYFQKNNTFLVAAVLLFFCALLSKENAVTFVAVVPLVFFFFTRAKTSDILMQTLPYLGATIIFLLIRGAIIGWEFGDSPDELMNNPYLKLVDNRYVDFTTGERLATVFFTLGLYLKLLLIPHPLTHDYYPRHIDLMSWSDPLVLLSLLAFLALGAWAVIRLPKKDHLAFAVLFFLITLSIVSNLVFPIGTHMSERFLYMPSVGFAMAIGILLYRAFVKRGEQQVSFNKLKIPLLITLAVGLLFSIKTISRNGAWKDNFTLFTTDVAVSSNSAKLRNSVGGETIAQAIKPENEAQKESMLREAVGHLEKAIQLHPTYKNAYLLLGNAHNYLNEFEKAASYYQTALKIDPNYQEAKNNLGITYRQAGRYYGEQKGDLQRSLNYLLKAHELRPQEYETLRLIGVAYGMGGKQEKAIEFFSKAAEAKPDNADAWWNLASAYHYNGQAEKAQEYRQKAIQIDPDIENRNQ
jgi:tetratricopeptide (TPR) repeat protein